MQRVESITVRPKPVAIPKLTPEEVKLMWRTNKDFTIAAITPPVQTGRYINKHDYEKYAWGAEVRCRYNQDQDLTILEERKSD